MKGSCDASDYSPATPYNRADNNNRQADTQRDDGHRYAASLDCNS
jgi:hypothetical protein